MDALTIHEAAETTGWSPRMLRYVESSGLIEARRSPAGYRLFGPEELQRLRTLRELLDERGVTLQEVGFALRLRRDEDLARAVEAWFEAQPARPADVAADDWLGGRGVFLGGAQVGGPFATPWRLERGPLLDLGPHVVDLLDAVLGPVVAVRASGDLLGWVGLLLTHESGAVSDVALCALMEPAAGRTSVEVHGPTRSVAVDVGAALDRDVFPTVAAELARTAAREPHPLDVVRGLHLQRVLADAEAQLRD